MVRYETACNGCPECVGCGRKWERYPVFICDKCGDYIDEEIYDVDGDMLCAKCALDTLSTIDPEQYYE